LNRNIKDFIAYVSYKSKYLAEVTASYKLDTATAAGSSREYWITDKLSMKKNEGRWVVYDSSAMYSILNEVVVDEGGNDAGKISVAWQNLYKSTPDMSGASKIDGLDVLSPTWFTLSSTNGDFTNIASLDYTNWAHQNGYKVWALVGNDFNRDMASKVLNNEAARKNAVNNLMHSEDVTLAIKKFVDNSPADKTKVIIIDELENSTGHVISKVMRVMMEKRDTLDLIPPLTGQTFDLSDVKFIITRNPNDGILHELPKYFAVHLNVYEIE
jgi:hypothetical protein